MTEKVPAYRFRRDVLTWIIARHSLTRTTDIADHLGVTPDSVEAVLRGAPVTAKVALHVSAKEGFRHNINVLFEPVGEETP